MYNHHYFSILKLHAAGIFVNLKERYFSYLEETDCDPFIQANSSTLGPHRVWPVFLIAGIGLLLATLVLIIEGLHSCPQRSKHNRKQRPQTPDFDMANAIT